MPAPDDLEYEYTLLTAVARYDILRTRDALASASSYVDQPGLLPLSDEEALELLALGELIARKATCGRQLDVRTARKAGASWAQIGQSLGCTKQAAWESHAKWLDEEVWTQKK
ncbi:hypothetical protein [Catenuloplanes japonicus]|uniref:hypothetical protein n=1 Tax=Catenuloplanes japonicus TaxID=33876 RepID=UPI000526B95D|nr:hypothetical protein [Catenuloplanes japonicus]